MLKLLPTDIVDDVLLVLQAATPGKGEYPQYLTAYQILGRLNTIRDRLLAERPDPGAGSGFHYSAASVVEQACQMLQRRGFVEVDYIATEGLWFDVHGHDAVRAGNQVCGIYRITRP